MSVTCIIPSYNDPIALRVAVESVLSQNSVDVSVLIVDDASNDATKAQLRQLEALDQRITLFILPENGGQARARNVGAMLATTPFISFLDQDDTIPSNWYALALSYLHEHADCGGISGDVNFIDIPSRLSVAADDQRLRGLSLVFTNNILFRRCVFLASGGFPTGEIWRTKIAGEDGAYRQGLAINWRLHQCDIPALNHTVKEGGATVYFLERTHVADNRVVFDDSDHKGMYGELERSQNQYWKSMEENREFLKRQLVLPAQDCREMQQSGIESIFYSVEPYCTKHTSYFQAYEHVLASMVGKSITFVEVGVFNGGSLAMWRRYLGPQARIIGIDLNPEAKRWEADGFEIFIGDQADPKFWKDFFGQVGQIDVLLDDGGHMNHQQLVTTAESLPFIHDGGLLIVEDVHTSYMEGFNSDPKHTFVEFGKHVADIVNARFPQIQQTNNPLKDCVWNVQFFEGIVVFYIDRNKCFTSSMIDNSGSVVTGVDFRHTGIPPRLSEEVLGLFE